MPRARLIAAAALAAAATPAVASAAPTVTTDRACYVADDDTIHFTGQGFTPNAPIGLFFAANGKFGNIDATADSAGAFQRDVNAPAFDTFDEEPPAFDLFVTANDQSKMGPEGVIGPPEESFAAVQFRVSDWTLDVAAFESTAAAVKRGKRVKVKTIGWADGGDALYIHYLRGKKAVYSTKVGALKGPCGDLTATFKAFAFKAAKPGTYAVRFSTSAEWNVKDRWIGYRKVRLVQ